MMSANENRFKDMDTPEGKKRMEEWIKEFVEKEKFRVEKMKNMMSNTYYLEWLSQFTQDKLGFADDDWLYFPEELQESDRENVDNLCLFYEGIEEYAKRVHFNPIPCEFGNYYKIRLNELGFKIGILIGQGTVFFCEKIPVENERDFIDFKDIIGNESKKDNNPKIKTKVFYAVVVYSELGQPEIKAYCRTKEIAKRELKKYTDEWQSKSPKPDDKHIWKLEMIVE